MARSTVVLKRKIWVDCGFGFSQSLRGAWGVVILVVGWFTGELFCRKCWSGRETYDIWFLYRVRGVREVA